MAKPVAVYVPAVRSGNHVFTSGQLPMKDGQLMLTGKVGGEVSEEQALECAQQCALNAIAAVKAELGDLALVRRVVKVVAFVASTPDFTGQPRVANGASELLGKAIRLMIDVKEEKDIDSLFSGGRTSALTQSIKGLDDFELISFLVVQEAA